MFSFLQNLTDDEKEYYKEKAKWEWDNRHITGQYQKKPSRNQNRTDCLGKPLAVSGFNSTPDQASVFLHKIKF